MQQLFFTLLISLFLYFGFPLRLEGDEEFQRCTALAIGRKATKDGSTVVSHGNDCPRCDFRMAWVPAQDHSKGSTRPVVMANNDYPRYVGKGFSDVYLPRSIELGLDVHWNVTQPMGYIPQVAHTYAYVDGTYGIMNEHQLAIGESTCDARLGPNAKPRQFGGKALLDVAVLSRIALERCKTARCAINTMGALAEEHGFYGGQLPDWLRSPDELDASEGGEALTIADPLEVWVFQISPDDTGASAVWVAQRVPDEEVHVTTNTFSVGQINLSDSDNFLASDNIYEVAIRNHFWDPSSSVPFDFSQVYGTFPHHQIGNHSMIDRRRWVVFNKVCPSCKFDPYLNAAVDDGDQYLPFSVKPDHPLDLQEIFALHRDVFQNTPFSLSDAAIAGPFGDPWRGIIPRRHPFNDTPEWQGFFERAVAQLWTSYTAITQSRSWLPDAIGGRFWYGPHDAVTTLFVPIYPGAARYGLHNALSTGSLFRVNSESLWWAVCVTANYMARWYSVLLPNVTSEQLRLETYMVDRATEAEKRALESSDITQTLMDEFQHSIAELALQEWWTFYWNLVGYFHDGTRFIHATIMQTRGILYPDSWLKVIGPGGTKTAEWNSAHKDPKFQTQPELEKEEQSHPLTAKPWPTSPPKTKTVNQSDIPQSSIVPEPMNPNSATNQSGFAQSLYSTSSLLSSESSHFMLCLACILGIAIGWVVRPRYELYFYGKKGEYTSID